MLHKPDTDTFLRSLFTYIHLCLLINPMCHVKRKGENKKKYFRLRLEQKRFSVLNKILLLEQTTCVHTIWHLTGYLLHPWINFDKILFAQIIYSVRDWYNGPDNKKGVLTDENIVYHSYFSFTFFGTAFRL